MARSSRGTVIVLEDHPDTCELYAEALAAGGFDVLVPREREDVVALVARLTPPVALTVDIGVSGAGYELARRLRALQPRPWLIAVTGRHPLDAAHEALVDAYLLKPCAPDLLVATVRRVLGDRGKPAVSTA